MENTPTSSPAASCDPISATTNAPQQPRQRFTTDPLRDGISGSIGRGRDQLCEEVWDAGEPVEVDAPPSRQGRRALAGEPVAQRGGRQVGGMEHLEETE